MPKKCSGLKFGIGGDVRHGAVARASTEAARPPGASEGRSRRSAYISALLRAPHPDLDLNRIAAIIALVLFATLLFAQSGNIAST